MSLPTGMLLSYRFPMPASVLTSVPCQAGASRVRVATTGLLLSLALAFGCEGVELGTFEQRARTGPCEPLAELLVLPSLSHVLTACISSDGKLYVVDRFWAWPCLFISEDEQLALQDESSREETSSADGTLLTFAFRERTPVLTVELWRGNDGRARMGVFRGALPTGAKQFTIGEEGEELELVASEDLTGFAFRPYTIKSEIAFAANVSATSLLVAVRRSRFAQVDDLSVFFGPVDRLELRASDVRRAEDGSLNIAFDVDGRAALASFPDEAKNATPHFTLDERELDFDLLQASDVAANAKYYCPR